mgnify:CR=1 FL=1|tara:strand:+ start:24651 stop:25538 length:888 start_codon:yes stop_codon:yes gene_type:complete
MSDALDSNVVVLYHDNCPDGFGAAWSFWKKYGNSAKYIPVRHGEPPPEVSKLNVFIVDFSYSKKILLSMKKKAESLVVLDHHISAKKELDGLDFCHFDMDHSGAYLAWDHLFGDSNVAPLVLYIEDRDLWKWELPNSNAILSAIDSYERNFECWDNLNNMLSLDHTTPDVSWGFNKLKSEGEAILRYKNSIIESILEDSLSMDICGEIIPAVNSPFFRSELGALLARNSNFSAVYYFDGERYIFSLRSTDAGADVSEIAKSFGGGGHKNAAGFSSLSIDEFFVGVENNESKKRNK